MPDSIWIALIGAASGAASLEVIRRLFSAADVRFDDARAIRAEQRERIHELEAEIRRLNEVYDALQERCSGIASENAALRARHERDVTDRGAS